MKAYSSLIAKWVPGEFVALGTDGYGRSESRPDLRHYFEIDDAHIALAALHALLRSGVETMDAIGDLIESRPIDAEKFNPTDA
jgi:pyruvate dehydrogenase E1 component